MQPGVTKDENLRTFCSMNPFLYHFDILAEFKFTNAVRKNTDVPVKKNKLIFLPLSQLHQAVSPYSLLVLVLTGSR